MKRFVYLFGLAGIITARILFTVLRTCMHVIDQGHQSKWKVVWLKGLVMALVGIELLWKPPKAAYVKRSGGYDPPPPTCSILNASYIYALCIASQSFLLCSHS